MNNGPPPQRPRLPEEERRRRKRELVLSVVIIFVVTLLTLAENRIVTFGANIPVSNTILMFILININLLLLILLIFLVFRNLVKLFYARRRKVMGSRLRTRLVLAFVALSLLPTTILFFFAINFITNSIEFWFNVPVEQALEKSLLVGQKFYRENEIRNRFFIERISYQIQRKNMTAPEKRKELNHYVQVVQREFDLDTVEVYSANYNRLTYALGDDVESAAVKAPPLGAFAVDGSGKEVHTLTDTLANGELLRTIGTVPFSVTKDEAVAYVALGLFIPPDLAENMESISRGFGEYQQIKLLKKPIQITYYITLSIVALLVLFCAVWFGFYLAKTITIPIMDLADGTRRVADGDLSVTIDSMAADDEIGSLIDAFNKMTRDLRSSRRQLELSARKLTEQNQEIEARRQYMEIVLKNVSAGVITTDANGIITTFNKSAERMLNFDASQILERHYSELLVTEHLEFTQDIMEEVMAVRDQTLEIPMRVVVSGQPRTFLVYVNALRDEQGNPIGFVMVFDDLTELEKAQRMAAWREVARRIAHEVKNPLTPISLSAQRLKRRYSERINEPVFDECTRMIIDHVDLIRNLVNEFSTFARFPTADLKPGQLPPIIEETVALYREGHPDVSFDVQLDESIPTLNLDRQQFKQAMINLVDNAVAAVHNQGHIAISAIYDPILKRVRLEVADDGSGIADTDKIRLFEPNFSTKKAGMGLGLTIVNSIVSDHNGMIRVQDNPPKGAKFVIELPT
ncbi:PAS domain-containing sensor histidine kinase [Desulfosarcina ovata subsp. sediminis]|uniref:histidine kinase n=1 Tax=Desulfosarcina ovata subsp. sediminis TaxID=885957 RepID=A0A5K7ZYJ5_9BACT|nr:ATP-binding protein [Desulfosarcina ovata]BBO85160.1 PAS domain-containing sensor histidine kinase [Desulfosarcina ovata subsp. sediminis]